MQIHFLIRATGAESLKIKRSLALLSAVLVPLVPAFVNFMMTLQRGVGKPAMGITNPWSIYFMYAIKLWVIFALPLIVSVLAALLADVDYRAKAWKQILALPFPRPAVMAGKWLVLVGLALLSTLVFGAANLTGGVLIHLLHPERGLGAPIPVLEAFTQPLIAWLLALFMISIHLWISLRWSNFLVSIIIGFAAAVANIFLLSSGLYAHSAVFPWAMPAQAYDRWQATLVFSLIGAAAVYWMARCELLNRDVYE